MDNSFEKDLTKSLQAQFEKQAQKYFSNTTSLNPLTGPLPQSTLGTGIASGSKYEKLSLEDIKRMLGDILSTESITIPKTKEQLHEEALEAARRIIYDEPSDSSSEL